MDDRTGRLYETPDAALRAGVPREHIIKLEGSAESIKRVSKAVKLLTKNQKKRERKRLAGKRGKP